MNKLYQVHILRIGIIFSYIVVTFLSARPFQASAISSDKDRSQQSNPEFIIQGPYFTQGIPPTVFNGDLRDLPQIPESQPAMAYPLWQIPGQDPKGDSAQALNWIDPVAQLADQAGTMPQPWINFDGLSRQDFSSGWPPDPNGDVGPNHYIQLVNVALAIYSKSTGDKLAAMSLNSFFTGPPDTPCDNNNRGDPIVLFDPYVNRWVITDFAWNNQISGPFYECIAVSQGSDPVSGGWYFYALLADTGSMQGWLNDYPKLGVWSDGWYMSANMFQQVGSGFAVRVWALNKLAMIHGDPIQVVYFDCTTPQCASLLPANARGTPPPAGAPNYFMAVDAPNKLYIWEFDVDWADPANSTFTEAAPLTVAEFATSLSIPQPDTTWLLDSLSYRLMMQLQYRNIGGAESLWVNHTVTSGGVAGVRWYQVENPGDIPFLKQQGTYQPDTHHRWMGSLAVDQDGNMAVGYSISSATIYPGIRYAGRLAGEIPGRLTQGETILVNGTGSQTTSNERWGDYSAMTVDPVDDCTLWYTSEYYTVTGNSWKTRIGAFKFPSCGQPKATLEGYVRNSISLQPIRDVEVVAQSSGNTLSVLTDDAGYYLMKLLPGSYTLTAGPSLPGFPTPAHVEGISLSAGITVTQDLVLTPIPNLVEGSLDVEDNGFIGNANHFPEPGETGIYLWEGLFNNGGTTSTGVTTFLTSHTPGVIVDDPVAYYPNIAAGATMMNLTPFLLTLSPSVVCGTEMQFTKVVTDSVATYQIDFTLNASVPLPRANVFFNDVESGLAGWTSGGSGNQWAIITADSHSPTHSWTDSPDADYGYNVNSFLQSPVYDLRGKRSVRVGGWFKHELEAGYDFVYLEYSLDGGVTWASQPLMEFNGYLGEWSYREVGASILDGQSIIALRFRLFTDGGVLSDGIYIDDVALSYEPFYCSYQPVYFPLLGK